MVGSSDGVDLGGGVAVEPRADPLATPEIFFKEGLTVLDVAAERPSEPRGVVEIDLAEALVVDVAGELVDGDGTIDDLRVFANLGVVGAGAVDVAVAVMPDQDVPGVLGIGGGLPRVGVRTRAVVMMAG